MSTQAVAWALDARQTGPLTAESRLVLVMLADYAGPDGRNAWPKKATIAHRLGVSTRAVQRSLAHLRAAGLIGEGDQRLVQHLDPRYRPTVYDLALNGVQVTIARNGDRFDLASEPYREDPHDTPTPTADPTPMTPAKLSTMDAARGDANVTPEPVRGDAGDSSGETPPSPYEPPLEPPLTHLPLKGDPDACAREATTDIPGRMVKRTPPPDSPAAAALAALHHATRRCEMCGRKDHDGLDGNGACRRCRVVQAVAQ